MFGIFRPFPDNGIGLVEEQNGRNIALLHLLAVIVEHSFQVLLALANPHTFDFRHIHLHNVAAGATGKLQHSFGFAGSGRTIEQTGKSTTEFLVFEPLANLLILAVFQQAGKLVNLPAYLVAEKQIFSRNFFGFYHIVAPFPRVTPGNVNLA